MTIKRGDIILVPFPFTDRAAEKVRPALVVSQSRYAQQTVSVLFISSIIPEHPSTTEVLVKSTQAAFKDTGLKKTSLIRCHKIATLDQRVILGKIGALPKNQLIQVNVTLKKVLGL